jgi:hypothetical protein
MRVLALAFLLAASVCVASPRFTDCATVVQHFSVPANLKLIGNDRAYATQLRRTVGQPVNFAGRFVLTGWGCGAGCVMGAAVDAQTGAVVMLPFTVSDWPLDVTEPLEFRKDSCLLIVHGRRNEEERGTFFYRFDGKRFQLLESSARSDIP